MTTETRQRIRAYKKALPELRERVIAVALLLAMSVSMLASASFAWITLSRSPEISGMQTTVAANGNLEIALAQGSTSKTAVAPGESQVGDSSAAEDQTIVGANVTWGNLVNVSDPTYGLNQIALRPALLSAYNRTNYPLNGATYGGDGRVVTTNDRYEYASYTKVEGSDKYYFAAGDKVNYGVRAISSVGYANVTGNVRIESFIKDTNTLYQNAQEYYGLIVAEKPNDVNTLDAASGVTCITALEGLVTVFAQDKINAMGYGYGKGNPTSCSGYIWYLKEMLLRLQTALQKEGFALLELANWQAYLAYEENPIDKTFATIDDVIAASNQKITVNGKTTTVLASKGVTISTLESYKDSVATIAYCLNGKGTDSDPGLLYMASKCENPDAPEVDYYWDDIAKYVNKLVDINTATLAGKKLSDINGVGDALDIAGGGDVMVYGGELYDIEKRFVNDDNRVQADVTVTVWVNYLFVKDMSIDGTVYTNAYGSEPDYAVDMAYAEGLDSSNKGEASAKDTYGLAIDLWVRTNYPDAVLTLEGSAKYEDQRATIKVDGTSYDLYTITSGEGDAQVETDVYQKDNKWYHASTMEEVTSEEMGSQTPKEKYVPVIVGYEGENRVWEDWRDLLEGGYIEQDATTQGAGSCFVFYASTPTEQAKIKEMLQAFNVAFIDQSGEILGTARLNLESAYENQGKVTVPLEVETGTDYTDESGAAHKGITRLAQNTPTLITAIVYLNGSKLQNENVLAEGELQGQLNIQFGTDSTLIAPDNEELQQQARTITATLTVNGETTSNGTIGGTEGLEYKADGYKATVNLNIDGDQPERISGFFVRVINATQGTRGEEKSFTRNADGTWTAEFTLTNPGTYVFDTLLVDGVQYTLHDGTEQSGLNQTYEANRPKVYIKGLRLNSVRVDVNPGTYMTAASSMEFPVTVKVDAAVPVKQVNAQFFNEDNSKQYTAILTRDQVNDQWVGSANISSSDTYTLKYVSVDGQILDAPATGSYTLYLGLTARVSTTVPAADRKYVYTGAAVQLPMRVYIYDDMHNLIPNLTGMELWYKNIISPAAMTWAGNYYEGVLDATNAGEMSFKEIVLGSIGTIRNVSGAPVFEASQVEPVDYVAGSGTVKFGNKVVIGDSTPDEMTVQFVNGQTADVWAVMTNTYANRTDIIPGVRNNADDQNMITFNVPTDVDGEWVLTKLLLQDCFDDQGDEYPVTGSAPTEADSLVFTLSAEKQAVMKSKIFATYNVSVTIGSTVKTYKSTDNKNVETVTVNLTPDEAGTFLEGHGTGSIVVTVTDYEGNPFNVVSADKSALQIQHDKDTTSKYGGYTGASGDKIDFTATANNGTVTFTGMTLNHAGEYNTNTFNVNIGGSVVPIKVQPKYTISSVKPVVIVTGVGTSGETLESSVGTAYRVYTVSEPTSASQLVGGNNGTAFSSYTTNSAVVYIQTPVKTGDNDQEAAEACAPTVTLSLKGAPSNATATMTFTTKNTNSLNSIFEFANGTATANVGKAVNGQRGTGLLIDVYDYPECYPAGLMTQNEIIITYGGIDYTVVLDETITINQPQYPPYVDFVVNDSLLTTPSRIYGTPRADGTFTVTLPTVAYVDENKDQVLSVLPTDLSTLTPTTTTSKYCQYSNWKWQKYDVTTKVYTATSSAKTWKVRHQVTGWLDANNTPISGDIFTITGATTLTAVVDTSYTHSDNTESVTYKRTVITIEHSEGGRVTQPSGYTNAAPPTAGDSGWIAQN